MTSTIEVHELAVPSAEGADGWTDFATAIGIQDDNMAAAYGSDDLRLTAAETLLDFLDQDNRPERLFVATIDGRIVGAARYELEAGDAPTTVWLGVDVAAGFRGRGVGLALSRWMQSVAATDGVRKAIVYTPSPRADGPQLSPPTGFGSVPAENPEVRFLLAAGYRLEQVVRGSRLGLPFDAGADLAHAVKASGAQYRLHYWTTMTPPEWREDLAMLRTRMSTEEPDAGLDEPEDSWSVERLVGDDQRTAESTRARLVVAVEDRETGRLAGFTALMVPHEVSRAVQQGDTLVLPEHRGHRLGMLLKLANLDYLSKTMPGHPSVLTFNAEENRYMLSVNEAVGFTPIGYEGAWRKDLPY